MGYFSKLRQSKEFARQKKADEKSAAASDPATPAARYKHVPRHARIDAENATALFHTEEQKQRIALNSKRRSQMLFSSRSNSGASTPTLGRSSSYQDGFGWNDRGDVHARPSARRANSNLSHNGVRQPSRMYMSNEPLPESHASSSSASNDPSPTDSSRTSLKSNSSSQEYLDMKRPKHVSGPYNDHEILEQLHRSPPSPTRIQPQPAPQIIFKSPQPQPAPVAAVPVDTEPKKSRFPWRRSATKT